MVKGTIEKYDRVDFMATYGIVPYSVWDLRGSMKYNNSIEKVLKERGQSTREGVAKYFNGAGERTKFKSTTSYFNPYLTRTILRSYSERGDWVFDPFASTTRPYIALLEGRNFVGCEVRKEEVEKMNKIIAVSSAFSQNEVLIKEMDCRDFVSSRKFDLVFTCPPYWNHERYSDLSSDLSTIDIYDDFLEEMKKVASVCCKYLKTDKYCVVVAGDFRDYSEGRKRIQRLVPFTADLIPVFESSGLTLYDKVIVIKPLGTAPARVKMWNNRKTVRIHEELLVFKK